jgi:hypothetical protein
MGSAGPAIYQKSWCDHSTRMRVANMAKGSAWRAEPFMIEASAGL